MREKIWATLIDTRFKGYQLDLLLNHFQRWDRKINIFLALSSSGSIAVWAVWKKYEIVWGAIIAISQVVTVIKPYFPYYKYVKELNAKCLRAENLNIGYERLWDNLQKANVNMQKTAETYYDLKKDANEIFNFSDDIIFTVSKKMENIANKRMKLFLKSNYNIDIDIIPKY